MKPDHGSRFGRNRFRIVYVNHFGSHRSGSVIHYGRGHPRPERRGCTTLSPSPQGQKSPCFVLRAGPKTQAGKAGACGSRPLRREGEAASTMTKEMPELPCAPNEHRSCEREAVSSTASSSQKQIGDCQESQRDVFEFSAPLKNANNLVRKPKKKSAVWHRVSKVISKMVEENGHFRNRLIHCSQLSNEGRDVNENVVTEASCMDAEEAIFGWV